MIRIPVPGRGRTGVMHATAMATDQHSSLAGVFIIHATAAGWSVAVAELA